VRLVRAVSVAALAALVLTAAGVPARSAPQARNGLIVYDSFRHGTADLYSMNAVGKKVRRLTRSLHDDEYPAWSPDGRRIAFGRSRDFVGSIYVATAAGGKLTRVTPTNVNAADPTWSPDGQKLAFTVFSDTTGPEIYVEDLRTGVMSDLTSALGGGLTPAWSPDGSKIAFISLRDDPTGDIYQLYTITPDGSKLTRLTNELSDHGAPNWAPNGSRLALSVYSGGNDRITIINVDGTGERKLTTPPAAVDPAWSPDGRRIAFSARPRSAPSRQIYVMSANGRGIRRLTHDRSEAAGPDWQRLP
jgi:TolB protein